ncbi:hypothetical protein V5N11_019525 [Cardamine amara subsp. amara]|uniref:Aspartic peptidase DDI1-type domain-containing protein n=1 Tax=Cardamine amara subsp. amara TaxID=228776 RepID=A0ABD0ZYY3_CARAN
MKDKEEMPAKNHECKAIVEKEIIVHVKLEDPGIFTFPFFLGESVFRNSLCDLGASLSLMPMCVAKRVGYDAYKSSKLSLVLADRAIRCPYGMLENLPLQIGNVEVPTDLSS